VSAQTVKCKTTKEKYEFTSATYFSIDEIRKKRMMHRMTLTHHDDRFQSEADTDEAAQREFAAQAERFREIVAPVIEAARLAGGQLAAEGLLNLWVDGYSGIYGYVPSRLQSRDQAQDQIASDVYGAFWPHAADGVRELVEQ
jgi:hypothetical protein